MNWRRWLGLRPAVEDAANKEKVRRSLERVDDYVVKRPERYQPKHRS
jgi:hypothetical protein